MTDDNDTVRRILIDAKALCTPEAWRQQGDQDPREWVSSRDCCAGIAINRAGRNMFAKTSNVTTARVVFRRTVNIHIITWNDTPGRTLAEVHAAFDAAIALVDAPSSSAGAGTTP